MHDPKFESAGHEILRGLAWPSPVFSRRAQSFPEIRRMYRCRSTVLCQERRVKTHVISLSPQRLEVLLNCVVHGDYSFFFELSVLHGDCRFCFQLCGTRDSIASLVMLISANIEIHFLWHQSGVIAKTDFFLILCRIFWVQRCHYGQ